MRYADQLVIDRWRDRMLYGPDNASSGHLQSNLAGANVVASGNILGSYGTRFVLVTYLASENLFVINGDRDSLTTNSHNAAVISTLRNERTVIIPYSALNGAGIDVRSIRLVDVRPDVWLDVPRAESDLANVPKWRKRRTEPVERTAADIAAVPYHAADSGPYETATGESLRYSHDIGDDATRPVFGYVTADGRVVSRENISHGPRIMPSADGLYHWQDTREVLDGRDIRNPETGLYEWTDHEHRLGDSLFTAVGNGRRRWYLSSFDYQERRPLYFLCELPRGHGARTVEDAITALAPPAVQHAIAQGRDVKRQGDIFAIPTDLPDAIVYGRARRRARLTQWTRAARPRVGEIGYRPPISKRQASAMRRYTRKRFHDMFGTFVESATVQPAGRPQTGEGYARTARRLRARNAREIANGRQGWSVYDPKPRYVKRDQYRARYGTRAAGILALARAEAIDRYHAVTYTPAIRERLRETLRIHGTTHSASEIVVCSGGVTYARGIMRHQIDLEGGPRERDHGNVKLGDQWHLMVRNTVPRASNPARVNA